MKPVPPEAAAVEDTSKEEERAPSPEDDIEALQRATKIIVRKIRKQDKGTAYAEFSKSLAHSKRCWEGEHKGRLIEAELLFGFADYLQFGLMAERKIDTNTENLPTGFADAVNTRLEQLVKQAKQNREGEPDTEMLRNQAEREQIFISCTEYMFTLTHHLLQNPNRRYLKELRRSLIEIAAAKIKHSHKLKGKEIDDEKAKRLSSKAVGVKWSGAVGQAAIYRMMEASGMKTSLAHPEKDALHEGDLECIVPERKEVIDVQAKRRARAKRMTVEVKETDTIRYPAVSAKLGEQREVVASSPATEDGPHLAEAASTRAKRREEIVTAIEIHIHGGGCDSITGVPKPETIKKCKAQLQELGIVT